MTWAQESEFNDRMTAAVGHIAIYKRMFYIKLLCTEFNLLSLYAIWMRNALNSQNLPRIHSLLSLYMTEVPSVTLEYDSFYFKSSHND